MPGKYLQTQGLRFVWNPLDGSVLNIFVKGGADGRVWSLLHDEQSYRIVVTKFLGLRRGDGYAPINGDNVHLSPTAQSALREYMEFIKPTTSNLFNSIFTLNIDDCLGSHSTDLYLRVGRGCGSVRTNLTELYGVPSELEIVLLLPNQYSIRGR